MKTNELTGATLNWAVAKCLPDEEFLFDQSRDPYTPDENGQPVWFRPAEDWAQGGPIIEREWLDVTPWPNESDEELRWQCVQHDNIDCTYFGDTPLIAAMRCYVASKLGDEVEIPKEVICQE